MRLQARLTAMDSRIRTCLIIAPAGSNLAILTDALRRRKIKVVEPSQLPIGSDFQADLADRLGSVDLVIGVMTRERRSEWVLFELGQAWALGKRILLFAPKTSAHLPSTLRSFITVRASPSNKEAINFTLDQLLAAPEPKRRLGVRTRQKQPLGQSAINYLQGSLPMIASANSVELESLVVHALREAGVEILSESHARDRGADLAIWSDELQPFVGNPLLVEIKARLQDAKAASSAAQQLAKYVSAGGSLWGLLIYGQGPRELRTLPPNIVALSIENLFERLGNETFDEIIRDLRNRRVHGVGSQ